MISMLRNWSRCYLAWVLMLNENYKPNHRLRQVSQTYFKLKNNKTEWYNIDHNNYSHLIKYIQRGAVQIDSGVPETMLIQIAFKTRAILYYWSLPTMTALRQTSLGNGRSDF